MKKMKESDWQLKLVDNGVRIFSGSRDCSKVTEHSVTKKLTTNFDDRSESMEQQTSLDLVG